MSFPLACVDVLLKDHLSWLVRIVIRFMLRCSCLQRINTREVDSCFSVLRLLFASVSFITSGSLIIFGLLLLCRVLFFCSKLTRGIKLLSRATFFVGMKKGSTEYFPCRVIEPWRFVFRLRAFILVLTNIVVSHFAWLRQHATVVWIECLALIWWLGAKTDLYTLLLSSLSVYNHRLSADLHLS